jgi:hypothetical protein
MIKNKIFNLLYFCVSIYNIKSQYNDDTLFFNILYISFQRSKATIEYLDSFTTYLDSVLEMHNTMISRMRNPSKLIEKNMSEYHNFIALDYYTILENTINTYTQYSSFINTFTDALSEEKKIILQKNKEIIALDIISHITDLENIITLIKDFFTNLNQSDQDIKYENKFLKDLLHNIKEKAALYYYYKKTYIQFDQLLIKQYNYFTNINSLFNNYYKQFWHFIENKRLMGIIKTYNTAMKTYMENNNHTPIKNLLLVDKKKLDEILPDVLYY